MHGILFDVFDDPMQFFFVANAVIERFVLPKGSLPIQKLIAIPCRFGFQAMHNSLARRPFLDVWPDGLYLRIQRPEDPVNVARHHDER